MTLVGIRFLIIVVVVVVVVVTTKLAGCGVDFGFTYLMPRPPRKLSYHCVRRQSSGSNSDVVRRHTERTATLVSLNTSLARLVGQSVQSGFSGKRVAK